MGLMALITLLLALSPLAFHGTHWLRVTALPLAILVGVFNALLHLGGSLLYRRKVGRSAQRAGAARNRSVAAVELLERLEGPR